MVGHAHQKRNSSIEANSSLPSIDKDHDQLIHAKIERILSRANMHQDMTTFMRHYLRSHPERVPNVVSIEELPNRMIRISYANKEKTYSDQSHRMAIDPLKDAFLKRLNSSGVSNWWKDYLKDSIENHREFRKSLPALDKIKSLVIKSNIGHLEFFSDGQPTGRIIFRNFAAAPAKP